MSKTLILLRHGHRDTTRRDLNNGLDDKGREQAKNIKRFFASRFEDAQLQRGLWLVSSPKLRCQETLLPTAKSLNRPVDVHPDLNEQEGREGGAGLEKRVHRFLHEWKQSNIGLTLVCSHGDWLPLATYDLFGVYHDFRKGAWLEMDWNGKEATLKWYVPSFKAFY